MSKERRKKKPRQLKRDEKLAPITAKQNLPSKPPQNQPEE